MRNPILRTLSLCLALIVSAASVAAQGYQTEPGWALELPSDPAGGGFFTLATSFPEESAGFVDGYALPGRILAASGRTLFLQERFGTSDFFPVATTSESMDPSFIAISPDGSQIAVGVGYFQPIYLASASLLSRSAPPNISAHPEVRAFEANYYDAIWRDSRYLLLNAGWFSGSAILILDTQADPPAEPVLLLEGIPGASAGLAIDHDGNVITGIGWDPDGARTGELAILPAAFVEAAIADEQPAVYGEETIVLAHNVLSAANLAVDLEGNLFVAGGNYVDGVEDQLGFAAVIDAEVIARVLAGGAPLDPEAEGELSLLTPYTCEMGYSSLTYLPGVEMTLVSLDDYMGCAPDEGPNTVAYFSPFAPDDDGDGIPNGMDPDHSPRQFMDRDYLDAFVDAFGATAADPTFVEAFDLDDDGVIAMSDFAILKSHWGAPRFR